MPSKEVIPALGLDSFSCPHCRALAHQYWFKCLPKSFSKDSRPFRVDANAVEKLRAKRGDNDEDDDNEDAGNARNEFVDRFDANEVTYMRLRYADNSNWEMVNMNLSRCHSCDGFAVWIKGELIWPFHKSHVQAHEDMPADVKSDFEEAATIFDFSPRGAAALLRLALQKLMVDLGEKGKDLNADIAALVQKGLEVEIQRALDIVRVVGNNAVHPGTIDLKDDTATASALFSLVNLVVDRRIAAKRRIEEMFLTLPQGALEQIKKRDGE